MKRFIKYAIEHLEVLHPHTREAFLKWLSFVFIKCVLYWEQKQIGYTVTHTRK